MRFVDLFAGLGGFHIALSRLGHECVFACEKQQHLREIYRKNFGLLPAEDIRSLDIGSVPAHDILCAGFPCQPFSKAGEQLGFDCPTNGDLFDYALQIVQRHKPRYLLFENVPNLKWHKNGETLDSLLARLKRLGYTVDHHRLSPHDFGIPQIRERIFIVGSRDGLVSFQWPVPTHQPRSIKVVLDKRPNAARSLPADVETCLETWQDFLDRMPSMTKFPPGPLWAMEFGATYPFEEATPYAIGVDGLRKYAGAFGESLKATPFAKVFDLLPSHARQRKRRFPDWKIRFIRGNREFYQQNRKWIDPWLPSIRRFPSSRQKLEWNCRGDDRIIWRYMIQLRASGVRVKRPTTAPSLIAMTTTQVPIVGWERRYVTPRECARLQSVGELQHLPSPDSRAFAALGNAVNADVVEMVAAALIGRGQTPVRHPPDNHQRSKGRKATTRGVRVA